jgi:hypothetical protein
MAGTSRFAVSGRCLPAGRRNNPRFDPSCRPPAGHGRIAAVEPLPLGPDGLADLIHTALAGGVGGWSLGVQGAVAEFPAGAPPAAVRRSGRTVTAVSPDGGLRLTVTDDTQAFIAVGADRPDRVEAVYLAVPRRSLADPPAGVSLSEGDPDALRPEDRDGLLVDLAVGHAAAAFCVRTDDSDLGGRLRSVAGAPWREALERIGAGLIAASPARVVVTPLGRAEVYTPIPLESGASPPGPHTHLLPALLETGRELPDGLALPVDLAPAAAFHPLPGWFPPVV